VPGEEVTAFLDAYIEAFAACGRGERDPRMLLEYFAAPVLLTTDDISTHLAGEGDILGWAQGQIDGMLAAGFDRIEVRDRAVELPNASTALVRGAFSRCRGDGSVLSNIDCTYVVTRADRIRIAALIVHSPA
jgi:hypothetical protein